MEQQARALESPQQDQPESPYAAHRTRLHLKPDDSNKPPLHLPVQRSNRRKEQGSLKLLSEY